MLLLSLLLVVQETTIAKEVQAKKETKATAVVSPILGKIISNKTRTTDIDKNDLQKELEQENALNRVLLEKKLAGTMAQIEELRFEKERRRLCQEAEEEALQRAHKKAMQSLQMEKEKLVMELELAQARFAKRMEQYSIQVAELDKKMQLEQGQTKLLQETRMHLQAEIEALHAKVEREKYIEKKPIYLKDPLRKKDNVLVLSDRCVRLDGFITSGKANYIVDQIQFFNNKSSLYPIFLIIGSSLGGEVRGGFNILQAIKHSKAAVYVVVKEFAASMAAFITTLATKSYALPNAEILHHQPWTFIDYPKNLRETQEQYNKLMQLWERLGGCVAKKMGISLKAFNAKLYEKSIHGNWGEYADRAKQLKWVDVVINGIEDSALSRLPDPTHYASEKKMGNRSQITALPLAADSCYTLEPYNFDYSYRPPNQLQKQLK